MATYWELLKDPRWQRMRLEVMQRDEFTCQECWATDKTLNVHHTHYVKGAKPWEYEPEALRTLCEECHERTEDELQELRVLIGQLMEEQRAEVCGYLRALVAVEFGGSKTPIEARAFPEFVGVGNYFGVPPRDFQRRERAIGRPLTAHEAIVWASSRCTALIAPEAACRLDEAIAGIRGAETE